MRSNYRVLRVSLFGVVGRVMVPAFCLLVGVFITAHAQSGTFNDGHGKEWLQLTATAGVSWNDTAQACPQDGVTACTGSVSGRNVNDWVWATDGQVLQLFSYFDADLASNRSAEGGTHFMSAQSFLSGATFQPTQSFCITYACGAFGGGWTATVNDGGLPFIGSVGWGTTPVSINGSFSVAATANSAEPQNTIGVWLWRATGPGPRAYDDVGSVASPAGGVALASVFGNDWMNGGGASSANVNIIPGLSSNPGVTLDLSDGSVNVAAATQAGSYSLSYRICDASDSSICDDARVTVVVNPYIVAAVNDSGWSSPSTGGAAVGNVLVNDRLSGTPATLANVSLSQVSVSPATDGITLDPSDGSIDVARGTALGNYVLSYRICDRTDLNNCNQATASILVRNYLIDAVNESARISSKTGGIAVANVLANDSFNSLRASTSNVQLSQVSPSIRGITLNLSTGAVSVAPKTASGTYSLVYRICEIASPTNCDDATVTLDLSGGGGGH